MSTGVLVRAAAKMRENADAVAQPWHPWGDDSIPVRSGVDAWQEDMRGYLGGVWGDYAAAWHPDVALAVADLLALAGTGRVTFTAAARHYLEKVARAYLGEDA